MKQSRVLGSLFIVIISLFSFSITPLQATNGGNGSTFQEWTNESLKENDWVEYKITYRKFSGENLVSETTGKVRYRLLLMNESLIVYSIETQQKAGWGQFITPQEFVLRNATDWEWDFTVIIPQFLNHIEKYNQQSAHGRYVVTEDHKKWETYHFAYKFTLNNVKKLDVHYTLDLDTKVALSYSIWQAGQDFNYRVSYDFQQASVYIGRELHDLGMYLLYSLPIVLPIVFMVYAYVRLPHPESDEMLEEEKKRRKSEEYKEDLIKEYEKERERYDF